MDWLIERLIIVLRGDSPLATWAGKDSTGGVRIYFDHAPPISIVGSPERYVVFHIIAGLTPEWDFDGNLVDEVIVQFDLIDNTNGSGRGVLNGYGLLCDVFEPPASGQLDGAGYGNVDATHTTQRVLRMTPLRGPESDDLGVWRGTVDFAIRINKVWNGGETKMSEPICGVDGTVTMGGLATLVYNFALVLEAREFDSTTFDNDDWETTVYGTKFGELTVSCKHSDTYADAPAFPGAEALVELSTGVVTYSGTLRVRRVSHDVTKTGDALIVLEGRFQGEVEPGNAASGS